ncbi:MAG: hypothetical protein HYZ26_10925 [Chloroflexi bacterium]|nr:hypothetical protein [Chloroflexota bacterium]
MRNRILLLLAAALSLGLILVAATVVQRLPQGAPGSASGQVAGPPAASATSEYPQTLDRIPGGWTALATQTDEQGEIEIAVTPLDLQEGAASIDFEISLNTHSVDLSMDLAEFATLLTDNGLELAAVGWDGSSGGHHVSGVLSFALTVEQARQLAKADEIRLILRDVGAPERVFRWQN